MWKNRFSEFHHDLGPTHRMILTPTSGGFYEQPGRFTLTAMNALRFHCDQTLNLFHHFDGSIPLLAVHRLDGTVVWEVPDYEARVVKLALLSI